MNSLKVEVHSLVKRFRLYASPTDRLIEWTTLGKLIRHTEFTALDTISFQIRASEFFGIIGPNGSGKSTLLKILTGVMMATSGRHRVEGRVTSLLELGTGFQPELSGRENVINSARLLNFTEDYMRRRLDAIVDFSGLEDQIDVPVKYYSSGMLMRLAFAMFAHVEPDVFIVDEALSVGDVAFSRKCFERLDRMRASGCTLLFASHDIAAIRKYCDQVLFLNHGRCAFLGPPLDATDLYLEAMSPGAQARGLAPNSTADKASRARISLPPLPPELAGEFSGASFAQLEAMKSARIGTNAVRIVAVKTTDLQGRPCSSFTVGDRMKLHILALALERTERATVSLQLVNRMGINVWGTNHALRTGQTTRVRPGDWLYATFEVKLDIMHDHYGLDVGWGDASGEGHVFDRITGAALIVVNPATHCDFQGLARLECDSHVESFETAGAVILSDSK